MKNDLEDVHGQIKNGLLKEIFDELKNLKVGELIPRHDEMLLVSRIPQRISIILGFLNQTDVFISRRALKHIIDRRDDLAERIVFKMALTISDPEKVADNSKNRKNSYLFLCPEDFVICVVIEKTKTIWQCQIVSAFPISRKAYGKLNDISGRAESPPFELPSK